MAQHSKFLAPLEGLRAVAALGIIGTHAAFDTGLNPTSTVGALLSRFDYFVAVFFVLSGFLLWRRHSHDTSYRRYYMNRLVRIMPAYILFAVLVLVVYPETIGVTLGEALATLTLTQLYIPDGLIPGMSHIWSLCVEVAFYLVLPLIALLMRPIRRRSARIITIIAVALISYGWAWLPFVEATPANGWANLQIFPISYASWFGAGMIAAELEDFPWPETWNQLWDMRWLWWTIAMFTAWMAGQEWYGPLGLEHPSPGAFNLRIAAGTLFGIAVVWPYALRPRPGLFSSAPFQALGRWSYGIFLWHLPIMGLMFPLAGLRLFSGNPVHTAVLWVGTVLITIPVAAASFLFVEDPCRLFLRRVRKAGSHSATVPSSPSAAGTLGRSHSQQHSPAHPDKIPAVDVSSIRPR